MENEIEVIKDPNGHNIVFFNKVLFRGRKKTDWKLVEKYLVKYIDKEYPVNMTGDLIYIGKDFPEEYIKSEYTYSLNRKYLKIKGNIVLGIPILIKEATDKTYKENKNYEKHHIDAKYGWYRFISRFALPVFDDKGVIKQYNIFRAEILTRHDADGKLYLYDILNIRENKKK